MEVSNGRHYCEYEYDFTGLLNNFRCSCNTRSKTYNEISSHLNISDYFRSLSPSFKLRVKLECKVCFPKPPVIKAQHSHTHDAPIHKVKPSVSRQNVWNLLKVCLQRNCAQSQIVYVVKWGTIEGYKKYIIHVSVLFIPLCELCALIVLGEGSVSSHWCFKAVWFKFYPFSVMCW